MLTSVKGVARVLFFVGGGVEYCYCVLIHSELCSVTHLVAVDGMEMCVCYDGA